MPKSYNLSQIRAMLIQGFTDKEIRELCYDTPDFRIVYDNLAKETGKAEIVALLLEHADRKGLLEHLLIWAQEHNATLYESYSPYYTVTVAKRKKTSNSSAGDKPAKKSAMASIAMLTTISIVVLCSLFVCIFFGFRIVSGLSPLLSAMEPLPTKVSETPLTVTPTPPNDVSSVNQAPQIDQATPLTIVEADASSFSSGNTSQPPTGAINGGIGTNYNDSWLSAVGDLTGSWIKLTFPETNVVTSISLYMVTENIRGAQVKNATLFFSDGSQQVINLPYKEGWQKVELKPVITNFVRLQIDDLYLNERVVEIREIQFFGRVASPSEASTISTPPKPVSEQLKFIEAESSSYAQGLTSTPPMDAINGKLAGGYNSSWLSSRGDLVGSWIKISLPEAHVITNIGLYMIIENPGGAQVKEATLFFSDGSEQKVKFPFEAGWQTVELQPVTSEYVRLQVDSLYGDGDMVEIKEVRCFGY